MKSVVAAAVVLSGLAYTAPATAQIPRSQLEPTKVDPKSDKVVCRREETVGTHFSKTVCMTRSQWKERDHIIQENRDHIVDAENRQQINNPNPPLPGGN
jgi:hypothetical protein